MPLLVVAATTPLGAQAPSAQPVHLDAGLGLGLSSTPPVWRGGGGPLGVSGYARLSFPTGPIAFGMELLQWLGRGEEVIQAGFPPPGTSVDPPRTHPVWLSRSQLLLVAVLPLERGPQLRLGVGLAVVEGIVRGQDCCLDAAGQWKEQLSGAALSLGTAFPRELGPSLRLLPGLDLSAQRVAGSTTMVLSGVVGLSWRRLTR